MNRALRDAMRIIAAAGRTVEAVRRRGPHIRIHCRDDRNGHAGVLTLHHGSILNRRFAAGLRADTRAIKRGHYHAAHA